LSWQELFRLVRSTLAATDLITDLRVDYLPRVGSDLLRLRAALWMLGLGELFGLLIVSGRTRTEDANRALEELASRVRADPALRDAFHQLDPPTLRARIDEDNQFAGFRSALDDFLAEYGQRETLSPLVMSAPTWIDDPALPLGVIKVLVEARPQAPATRPSADAERRLLDHRLLRSPRRRAAALHLVEAARAGVAFREDSHFYATWAIPMLRRTLLEAGHRLAAAGVLPRAEDVFHLRLEELEAVTEPDRLPAVTADWMRGVAAARAARRAELAGVPMIAAANLLDPAAESEGALVSGVPASGGRATGPARVIREPAEFGTMRSGDVLVCPYTNPAWTPLFQRAVAVVVDSGGVGSHAAIVAREYGIPAVMGTGSATRVLADGQRITVDGDIGRVTAA